MFTCSDSAVCCLICAKIARVIFFTGYCILISTGLNCRLGYSYFGMELCEIFIDYRSDECYLVDNIVYQSASEQYHNPQEYFRTNVLFRDQTDVVGIQLCPFNDFIILIKTCRTCRYGKIETLSNSRHTIIKLNICIMKYRAYFIIGKQVLLYLG